MQREDANSRQTSEQLRNMASTRQLHWSMIKGQSEVLIHHPQHITIWWTSLDNSRINSSSRFRAKVYISCKKLFLYLKVMLITADPLQAISLVVNRRPTLEHLRTPLIIKALPIRMGSVLLPKTHMESWYRDLRLQIRWITTTMDTKVQQQQPQFLLLYLEDQGNNRDLVNILYLSTRDNNSCNPPLIMLNPIVKTSTAWNSGCLRKMALVLLLKLAAFKRMEFQIL